MSGTVVVLGAGQAGGQAAASLRENGWLGRVVLVGEEPQLPYQRPPLSKAHLKGEIDAERLQLWPSAFYRDRGIELRLSVAVRKLEPRARRVMLSDGEEIGFDIAVIATGTRARIPPFPGTRLEGVLSLRTIADVERLRSKLNHGRRVVIVGGGYIGLEVAAVLREMGKDVAIVEAEDRLLKRVCAEPTGRFFERLHRDFGVDVITGARVAGLTGDRQVDGVTLGDGRRLSADLVLLAVGAQANAELAQDAGLAVQDGIVVDALGRTSAAGIYACGDCARYPSRRFGRGVRLESVQNAIEQAKAVSATIAGKPTSHDPVPWFWSDQYRTKLQIAGLSDGGDAVTVTGDPERGPMAVEYRRESALVAVDTIDNARAHMLARRAIAAATASSASSNSPDDQNDRPATSPAGTEEMPDRPLGFRGGGAEERPTRDCV